MKMGVSWRHFLFDADGQVWGISKRTAEDLALGRDRLPQYAGQCLRVATVYLDLVDGKPQGITNVQGSIWHVDQRGDVRQSLARAGMEAWHSADLLKAEQANDGPVVSIMGRRRRQEWERTNRWEPSPTEITRMVHVIWPEQAGRMIPKPKWVRGVRKRRPPMTYEAKAALRECSSAANTIEFGISELSEPSLKAFIDEGNERASDGSLTERAVWAGIVQVAETRLRVLQARKRKGGTWIAAVNLVVWESDNMARHDPLAVERCAGRDKAEARARAMVREHADKVGFGMSLDVTIVPEIEWQEAPE